MARDPTTAVLGRPEGPDPESDSPVSDHEIRGQSLARRPGSDRGRLRLRRLLAAVAGLFLVICSAAALWIASLGPAPVGEGLTLSTEVLDRNGTLLRAYATAEGRWRLPVRPENVDPRFFDLLFAYEDKRFLTHHGVDPAALARALAQFASHGRIVSGASTLTMQVARLLEPRAERSFAAKLKQMVRAMRNRKEAEQG